MQLGGSVGAERDVRIATDGAGERSNPRPVQVHLCVVVMIDAKVWIDERARREREGAPNPDVLGQPAGTDSRTRCVRLSKPARSLLPCRVVEGCLEPSG